MNSKSARKTGSRNRQKHLQNGGMTLIELMIVIAVLAVLTAVAVPSYNGYVLRANRAEAIDVLLATAACQERVYTKKNRYDKTACDINTNTSNGHYRIQFSKFDDAAGQTYTLRARARNNQLKDSCGHLTLTDKGLRGASKAKGKKKTADCWKGKKIS